MKHITKADRVLKIKGPLNGTINAYENGTIREGVQAIQRKVLVAIKESGLSEHKNVYAGNAAVHPSNRDGSGLVPADVHDLMKIIAEPYNGGWDDTQCAAALACEIHRACAVPHWCAAHACSIYMSLYTCVYI